MIGIVLIFAGWLALAIPKGTEPEDVTPYRVGSAVLVLLLGLLQSGHSLYLGEFCKPLDTCSGVAAYITDRTPEKP
jgi:hypothetical protein